jgi:hypothetical protein
VPIVFESYGEIGPPINISAFVNGAKMTPAGPQPGQLPANIPTVRLGKNQAALQPFAGPPGSKTVVINLLTCAAVLYASTDPAATAGIWIHHADAGAVSRNDVDTALQNLGDPPPGSVLVVVALERRPDPNYDESFRTMVGRGISDDSIIVIPNVFGSQFGADNLGQLGF